MVAEMHGVWTSGGDRSGQWISICQVGADAIELSYPYSAKPLMTVAQARYLASKLNRIASKIEEQQNA